MNIFLSASIPLPGRHPRFLETVDVVAVRESIKALVEVTGEHDALVFGGHPAITPLISLLLRARPPAERKRVILYQSDLFVDEFVPENDEFVDVRIVKGVAGNRQESLRRMRTEMLGAFRYDAAIFIGGMEGLFDEFDMFRQMNPHAKLLPIASTGAAALELWREHAALEPRLLEELTYPTLFRSVLEADRPIQ